MSDSKLEEVIAALWVICSITAFGFGFTGWGWCFAIKGAFDVLCSLKAAIHELIAEQCEPQGDASK